MADSGTRLEIIQQFFGHESIEISRRYAHIADQTLKADQPIPRAISSRGHLRP
jgi:site-specific recombinase XerD